MNSIYQFDIEVAPADVDRNGHVNNVVYIQWMQDAAIAHARASGCTKASEAVGATWVVRTHHVEYLSPAFAGDKITVLTWAANFQRVRSLRKYKFIRAKDRAILARAETDWVFVNAETGPAAIDSGGGQEFVADRRQRHGTLTPCEIHYAHCYNYLHHAR